MALKKIAERVEFGVTNGTVQAHSNGLRDRRIHTCKDGDASCDFLHGYGVVRVQTVAAFSTFASSIRFGHFHAARQIQVNKGHLRISCARMCALNDQPELIELA